MDTTKPLMIELYAGLHGWGEGGIAEGYRVRGYDIVDMCAELGHERPAGIELVIRDVRSIHGSECKDAAVICASPPCQAYSYRAMPWKKAKALPPPDNILFNECFRIQREASEAAGRYIPLIVENVRGAQKWVGRAKWHYGSFYLWGDVPALMPLTFGGIKVGRGAERRIAGGRMGSFGIEEGIKVGMASERRWEDRPVKRLRDAVKNGGDWFGSGTDCSAQRRESSKSNRRKAASALIAKIPFPLAQHIARSFKPV